MKNDSGFTLAEVLVAIGLVGIAVLGTFNVMSYFSLRYNRSFLKTDSSLSVTLGERFLYMHFKNAYPSFNNFKSQVVVDDSGRDFYDLNADFPVRQRSPAGSNSRTLTLGKNGKTSMYVLIGNSQDGPPLYIDPVRLFMVGPGDGSKSGPLTYQGFTHNGYIQRLSGIEQKQGMKPLWRDGNLLYLYLPTTVRIPSLTDPNSDAAFVSPYCFFGTVEGADLAIENFNGLIQCRNPQSGQPVTSVQDFMLNMPSLQGAIPVVLLRSVSLLRYDLKPSQIDPQSYDLVFSRWSNGVFADPQTAATNISSVEFKRNSIADTVISISVTPKEEKK